MKRTIFGFLLIIFLFVSVLVVQAANTQEVQVQNREQNEVQTQNQGESQQFQVKTQEEEKTQLQFNVAVQAVGKLLAVPERVGEANEQVRQAAQAQNQAQEEIQSQLMKMESRGDLLKKVIGPDYRSIKNLEQLMEQNQERIRLLEELENQVANYSDRTQIQEVVQALVELNNVLAERINAENQIKSLLGWLFKFLAR